MALFHLLLNAEYPFEAAHIDHGWRQESAEEATYVAEVCKERGIVAHLTRLSPVVEKRNLEERGRDARHAFFEEILKERNLEGVLLAHHADDQAETVLKRVFEGASLPKLKGLSPKTELKKFPIYRPLLKVRKETILTWLQANEIRYFLDPTNKDLRFLRSRLREELIPTLSERFGKEVANSLCRIGEAAAELGEFLALLTAPYRLRVKHEEGGISLDFSFDPPESTFLWKVVIRDFFEMQRVALSNAPLEAILAHLQKKSCHKVLKVGGREVLIHRGKLVLAAKICK